MKVNSPGVSSVLSFVFLGEITFSLLLLGLLFGSLAMAIGGFTGKSGASMGVSSAVGIVPYLLNSMSKIFQGLKPFQPVSVFHHYDGGEVLLNGINFGDVKILLAGTVVLFAVGMYGFQLFQKALELNNYNASGHYNMGLLLEKTGNYEQALDHYEFAFNIDDQHVDVYNNYGLLLMNVKKDYKEALKYFERVINVDPGYVFAYYNRGIALINLERYDEARRSLRRVMEMVYPEKKLYKQASDLLDGLKG